MSVSQIKKGRAPAMSQSGGSPDSSGLYYKAIMIVIMTIVSDATIWSVTFEGSFTIVTWLFPMFMVLASFVTIVK